MHMRVSMRLYRASRRRLDPFTFPNIRAPWPQMPMEDLAEVQPVVTDEMRQAMNDPEVASLIDRLLMCWTNGQCEFRSRDKSE